MTDALTKKKKVAKTQRFLNISKFAVLKFCNQNEGFAKSQSISKVGQSGNVINKKDNFDLHRKPEYEILSKGGFESKMMNTRQNDSSWQYIRYISSIMLDKEDIWMVYRFKFIYDEYCFDDKDLWQRAENYVKNLLDDYKYNNVIADRKFCDQLLREDKNLYVQYACFKIIRFHEIHCQIRIDKALFEFTQDEKENLWLFNVTNIHYRSSLEKTYDRFIVKKIELKDANYKKEALVDVYNEKVYWDPVRKKAIDEKRNMLHYLYEQIKKDID